MLNCSDCPLYLLFRSIFTGEADHFCDRIISMIKTVVSIQTGVSITDLESKTRKKHIVKARNLAMGRCREFDIPFSVIGQAFNRSHSTVISAIKTFPPYWRIRS